MFRRDLLSALGTLGLFPPFIGSSRDAKAEGSKAMLERVTPGEESAMSIERFELTPGLPGIPRISYATSHGGIVYVAGITANPRRLGDVKDQTREVLARIDFLLSEARTDKSKLLTAQVWLTDMNLFSDHNDAWNDWIDPRHAPVRACLLSPQLWRPGMLVEIMVTAAR